MRTNIFNPVFDSTLKTLLWPGPKIVFEIGACEAEDTVRYAKLFPKAKFFLFEPLPANQIKIQAKLIRHKKIRAKLYKYALSNVIGKAKLYVSSGSNKKDKLKGNKSSSLLKPGNLPKSLKWLKFKRAEIVKTITLDKICNLENIKHISYMHIDAQGAEIKILKGGLKILPKVRAIWMEVAFEKTYDEQPIEPEASRWMLRHGFRKIHQQNQGPEGDILYLNMKHTFSWPLLIILRMLQVLDVVKR